MVDGIGSSLNGLQDASNRLSTAARNISRASVPNANVNVDKEVVDSVVAAIQYKANAKVLKAQLDTEQRLLDILT